MGTTYLLHVDGRLPNLALMRISTRLKSYGLDVRFVRGFREPGLFEPKPESCIGSSIFSFSNRIRARIEGAWGSVLWGGTGVDASIDLSSIDASIDWESVIPDYSLYPDFDPSIGFTQRGCRLRCKFCVVPVKEGRPRATATIDKIWRGDGHPKKLILLDNDFFGQPVEEWRSRIREIKDGGFRVCLCQGINVRQIDSEAATALASIEYRDIKFESRTLYTAWDNIGDESAFKRGVQTLAAVGIPPTRIRVYMLVGYLQSETWERIFYRFNEMVAMGCEPYPMVYDMKRADLRAFQRWAVTGLYRAVPWEKYRDPRIDSLRSVIPEPSSDDPNQTKLFQNECDGVCGI